MYGSANSVGADSAGMTHEDLAALRRAAHSLEHPGLAARLTNMLGKPIELIGQALPASASQVITAATSKALEAALKVALGTMRRSPHAASQLLHKALATASGAAAAKAVIGYRNSHAAFTILQPSGMRIRLSTST